jgi:AAA15 family ATPase/GTPase
MKITAIKTSNFLGARDVDVKLAKPICLFAGKNAPASPLCRRQCAWL